MIDKVMRNEWWKGTQGNEATGIQGRRVHDKRKKWSKRLIRSDGETVKEMKEKRDRNGNEKWVKRGNTR